MSNDRIPAHDVQEKKTARYLHRYLKDLHAKTLLVENGYTDADYLDDFASYYVKCFFQYERRCKRLHFFSKPFSKSSFISILLGNVTRKTLSTFKKAYLGFVIARPLPDAIIGRTVLKTYPSGRRHFSGTRMYRANLFGIELSVQSLAFQEQDTVLAACATVSLWCCFNKTSELFNLPLPTPAEITRSANQIIHQSRPIPSHGLTVQQICSAIRHVGLEPEVISIKPNTPLLSLIYAYLEMGLPVILGVDVDGAGFHAITLTGYSLRHKTKILDHEVANGQASLRMIGLRIDKFYAHDDQIGPFSRVFSKPSVAVNGKVYPVAFDGSWVKEDSRTTLPLLPIVAIVPVYHKIRVTFLDINEWLTRLSEILPLLFSDCQFLEWDVHLITTNDFKRFLKSRNILKNYPLKDKLLHQNPRFIWRAILRNGGDEVFELLADATDMARSFPIYDAVWYDEKVRSTLSKCLKSRTLEKALISVLTRRMWQFLKECTERRAKRRQDV